MAELQQAAIAAGHAAAVPIRAVVRTGDTPNRDRAAMLRRPPHLLVTTPESLYLLLTSAKGREMLRGVETVIVDEIHALARDKRGSHLSITLERLDRLVRQTAAANRPVGDASADRGNRAVFGGQRGNVDDR